MKNYLKKNIQFIGNKNMTNTYEIQACDSIMCRYVCIGFFDFMLKVKSSLDYTNLFPPNDCEKNDQTVLKYFQ